MAERLYPTVRLEAFSDGVLAVVITIMVLELKVPEKDGIRGLLSIAPTLFVYLLSFCFTGIYWILPTAHTDETCSTIKKD